MTACRHLLRHLVEDLSRGPASDDATIASGVSAFAAVTNGAKSTSVARTDLLRDRDAVRLKHP